MLNYAIKRTDNRLKAEFPNGVIIADEITITEKEVRFRVRGYADEIAFSESLVVAEDSGPGWTENQTHVFERHHSVDQASFALTVGNGSAFESAADSVEAHMLTMSEYEGATVSV